jgi:hypothetical protein
MKKSDELFQIANSKQPIYDQIIELCTLDANHGQYDHEFNFLFDVELVRKLQSEGFEISTPNRSNLESVTIVSWRK